MKKICFLVPDVTAAQDVLVEIRKLGITDEQIHGIANDKTKLDALPDADSIEENDVISGAVRGAVAGSATGMVLGLVAAVVPAAGVIAIGSAAAAWALGGASFGVWMGSLVGSSVPNSQLDEWREQLDKGNVLIVLETEDALVSDVTSLLESHHLSVIDYGEKGDIPLL